MILWAPGASTSYEAEDDDQRGSCPEESVIIEAKQEGGERAAKRRGTMFSKGQACIAGWVL